MGDELHLSVTDLDEAARQLRALSKENIIVPCITVAGHTFVLESTVDEGQAGAAQRSYTITDIEPCRGC